MPRFVLLKHDAPSSPHWDFMLEAGVGLATWSLPAIPLAGQTLIAHKLDDHRAEYLDYEGPVSNDRGYVTRHDQGEFQWLEQTEAKLQIAIEGEELQGQIVIEQIPDKPARDWQLTFTS